MREKVKAGALWYIYEIRELIEELQKGLPNGQMEVVGKAAYQDFMFRYETERRVGLGGNGPPTLTAN